MTPARGNDEEVSAGWGNHYIRARGPYLIVIVALLAVGLALTYANFHIAAINQEGFTRLEGELKSLTAMTRAQDQAFAQLSREHQHLVEAVDAMIYVMTLNPEQRAKLNLERPRYLRGLQKKEH